MDYFNGLTNDDFVKYFVGVLRCRMELTNYTYPHEFTEPDDATDDHIKRCFVILNEYFRFVLKEAIEDSDQIIEDEEMAEIYQKIKSEIYPLLDQYIEQYLSQVKVNYVDLDPATDLDILTE